MSGGGCIALLYTGMGFPPVVVGLFVYLMLSRSGPLGRLHWPIIPALFTPEAMVVAQSIIPMLLTVCSVRVRVPDAHRDLVGTAVHDRR